MIYRNATIAFNATLLVLILAITWMFSEGYKSYPAPIKVELTPEVKYEIQKQVQREVRKLTKPVLPMVAPDKVKVKR